MERGQTSPNVRSRTNLLLSLRKQRVYPARCPCLLRRGKGGRSPIASPDTSQSTIHFMSPQKQHPGTRGVSLMKMCLSAYQNNFAHGPNMLRTLHTGDKAHYRVCVGVRARRTAAAAARAVSSLCSDDPSLFWSILAEVFLDNTLSIQTPGMIPNPPRQKKNIQQEGRANTRLAPHTGVRARKTIL